VAVAAQRSSAVACGLSADSALDAGGLLLRTCSRCCASSGAARDSLLKSPSDHLCSRMLDVARYPEHREVRKAVWKFARGAETGLPSASLKAAFEWHPLLFARVKTFLKKLQEQFGYEEAPNLGQRLAKKKLSNEPMLQALDKKTLSTRSGVSRRFMGSRARVLTQCYIWQKKEHLKSILEGTDAEVGRIG